MTQPELREYFTKVIYPYGILPFQLENEDVPAYHLRFIEELADAFSDWTPVKV